MQPKHHLGHHHIGVFIALLCASCVPLPNVQSVPAETWQNSEQHPADTNADLSPARFGALMSQVTAMESTAAHQEIARLKRGAAQRSAAERLKLAGLLSQRGNSALGDLYQAEVLLEDLIPSLKNSDTRALTQLLQRNIKLQLSLNEEHKKVAEFTHKIQQLKGLEEDLQQHNLTTDPASVAPTTPGAPGP